MKIRPQSLEARVSELRTKNRPIFIIIRYFHSVVCTLFLHDHFCTSNFTALMRNGVIIIGDRRGSGLPRNQNLFHPRTFRRPQIVNCHLICIFMSSFCAAEVHRAVRCQPKLPAGLFRFFFPPFRVLPGKKTTQTPGRYGHMAKVSRPLSMGLGMGTWQYAEGREKKRKRPTLTGAEPGACAWESSATAAAPPIRPRDALSWFPFYVLRSGAPRTSPRFGAGQRWPFSLFFPSLPRIAMCPY